MTNRLRGLPDIRSDVEDSDSPPVRGASIGSEGDAAGVLQGAQQGTQHGVTRGSCADRGRRWWHWPAVDGGNARLRLPIQSHHHRSCHWLDLALIAATPPWACTYIQRHLCT